MKMPQRYAEDIITPALALLDPNQLHEQEEVVEADGSEMMKLGMYKTEDGVPVLHGVLYVYSRTVLAPVNHRKNLICLMEASANLEQMQNYLAEYLVRYGKPPAHLQTNKTE
jgi:hypothetical protein